MPLRLKLFVYFLVFGTIILVVLWVFQSFFVKPIYTMSKTVKLEKGAASISRAVKYNKNVWATIDDVALTYTLSVYLYNVGGGAPQREHVCSYENPAVQLQVDYRDVLRYYEKTVDSGGACTLTDSNDADDIIRQRTQ